MFLQGFINENLEPIAENVFVIGQAGHIAVEAVLDTGFNGMLCLPRKLQCIWLVVGQRGAGGGAALEVL